MKPAALYNLFLKASVAALLAVPVLIGTACSSSANSDKASAATISTPSETVVGEAFTVVGDQNDGSTYLLKEDGTIVGGTPLNGIASTMFNGLFVSGVVNDFNVYRADDPLTKINSAPFTSITDFRTGFAYATRPGRPIMVVNRNGAVVRLLPDDIKVVNLAPGNPNCIRYSKTDNTTGLLRPNGDPLAEFEAGSGVGPLANGRYLVQHARNNRISVYDEKGREIITFAPGTTPTSDSYRDGWLGVIEPDSTSYFIDVDGNKVRVMPANYTARERVGNVAMAFNTKTRTHAMINVDNGHFIMQNINGYHTFTNDGKQLFLLSTNDNPDSFIVVDSTGKKIRDTGWNTNTDKILGIANNTILIEDGGHAVKVKNIATGDDLTAGNLNITRILSELTFDFVVNPTTTFNDAAKIVDGISAKGWTLDNYMYSSTQTSKQLLSGDYTADEVFETYNEGKRFISKTIGGTSYCLVFDSMPVKHETVEQTHSLGFFSYTSQDEVNDWNPDSHLLAIFRHINPSPDKSGDLIKAVKKQLSDNGFVGYYDQPNQLSNGDTHVYFLPTESGFYIIVSFRPIDYQRFLDVDFTDPSLNNIATN